VKFDGFGVRMDFREKKMLFQVAFACRLSMWQEDQHDKKDTYPRDDTRRMRCEKWHFSLNRVNTAKSEDFLVLVQYEMSIWYQVRVRFVIARRS
jgi:hypothetical protein